MGLSARFLDAHIGEWEQKLKGSTYPHRENWPRHLFHHTPLENAVSILTSGQLLSRIDSDKIRARDVAAAGVIDTSARAHHFARLYFRPRTPTQYHIEGIRRPGECQFGENAHAPVLIMFVFDARRVLSLQDIRFSDSNMQTGTHEGSTEVFFRAIPFDKVYHVGGFAGDHSITSRRGAEVLAPSPMVLDGKLSRIYCRSEAERETLMQRLGSHVARWEKRIRISDDLKVFEKRFAFVEKVSLANDRVNFRLNPRHDLLPISVRLEARGADGRPCVRFRSDGIVAKPPNPWAWYVRAQLGYGAYKVVIELDGQIAYDTILRLDDIPF